jgi:hypothetical protein
MSASPDRELITQSAARQLLERAGQIDSDSTSVDTLRAAAREAGISDAAFEAALIEMRSKAATPAVAPPSPWKRRFMVAMAAAAMLFATALFVIPAAVESPPEILSHEFVVQCLPMSQAQDIAQKILVNPGNEVRMARGSRIMRVRATAEEFRALQAALESAAKGLTSCDNTPVR